MRVELQEAEGGVVLQRVPPSLLANTDAGVVVLPGALKEERCSSPLLPQVLMI